MEGLCRDADGGSRELDSESLGVWMAEGLGVWCGGGGGLEGWRSGLGGDHPAVDGL